MIKLHVFFGDFSIDHKNDRSKEKHRNPNVIVAQYIGTGNLLGQISQGILDSKPLTPIRLSIFLLINGGG